MKGTKCISCLSQAEAAIVAGSASDGPFNMMHIAVNTEDPEDHSAAAITSSTGPENTNYCCTSRTALSSSLIILHSASTTQSGKQCIINATLDS